MPILKLSRVMLHFLKFSSLKTTFQIVYGQITKILTEWQIVKWPLIFTQTRAKPVLTVTICKKLRRIVWNKFPAWGKMRRRLKSRFSRNFSKKSHFWHVIKSQKNFLVKSRQWGSKTKVLTYFLEVLYSVISPRDQIVVNFQFTIFDH